MRKANLKLLILVFFARQFEKNIFCNKIKYKYKITNKSRYKITN